ncbi:hypothetical protein RN04_02690 [Arthrobacter sp. W1]|nr:hypothetical protein RN04_02690 [Arthrobacter sp. W1]
MVVTNYAPQFGELDPIRLDLWADMPVADAEHDEAVRDICYPVDGDALARLRAQEQHRRAEDANMTTLSLVPWAQNMLDIDRLGATGQWVQGAVYLGRPICEWQRWHAYRRWAEL